RDTVDADTPASRATSRALTPIAVTPFGDSDIPCDQAAKRASERDRASTLRHQFAHLMANGHLRPRRFCRSRPIDDAAHTLPTFCHVVAARLRKVAASETRGVRPRTEPVRARGGPARVARHEVRR